MKRDYKVKLAALEAGTLAADDFDHRDHIGVAWEALRGQEFFAATKTIADGLRHVTRLAGVPEKYSATVTLAFMSLIAERMGPEPDADTFIDANPGLFDMSSISGLYPGLDLWSDKARAVGLLPQPRQVR